MAAGQTVAKIAAYGFSLVFCSVGLGLAYGAAATFQEGDSGKAVLMLFAALAFGGFGFAVFALSRAGFRKSQREDELRAAHPDEPWKWHEEWGDGRIRSARGSETRFLWGFAILWNLISTPMMLALSEEITEKENYGALIGLLFPIVGIGLLVAAVRKTIQARKFGECLFLMDRVPGVLGGDVAGTVIVPRGLSGSEPVSVKLSCIREVKQRSGKSTSTSEHVEWNVEKPAVLLTPTGDGTGHSARLLFSIPYDSSPTGRIDANKRIFWKLEASAAVPGVDFATAFEIPVYKTRASSPQKTEELLRSEEMLAETQPMLPLDQTIVSVGPSAGGGTEFVIRPSKGMSGKPGALILTLIFGGIALLLGYAGAPFLFPLVFGGIALFVLLLSVFIAFGESRIVVENGYVSVRNSLFGIMRGKRISCSSITKIGISGDGKTGQRGYYSITLTGQDGKKSSPLQALPDRRQASWLAEEVRKAIEPWRHQERTQAASRI